MSRMPNLIKKIIKWIAIAASIIALIPIIYVLSIVVIIVVISLFLYSPPPSDAEMIEQFKQNEKLFEELRIMAESDSSLSDFPLSSIKKFIGETMPISEDREQEYDSLMKKIKIKSFYGKKFVYSRVPNHKIIFFINSEYPNSWITEKGFEYIPDRAKEKKNKKFMEKELYDLAKEEGQDCSLYKKINENWNLYLVWENN